MTIVVLGAHSQIAQEFKKLVPPHKRLIRGELEFVDATADEYLICSGFLLGEVVGRQSVDDVTKSFMSNYVKVINYCDVVFSLNPCARICIIGSESGYNGSYDMAYAGAKAALHMYIKTKKLSFRQQLVGISPWIVEDAGMTLRRQDFGHLSDLKNNHPKKRFLKSTEVARLAHYLLFIDEGYITNTIIRMHGGKRQ